MAPTIQAQLSHADYKHFCGICEKRGISRYVLFKEAALEIIKKNQNNQQVAA